MSGSDGGQRGDGLGAEGQGAVLAFATVPGCDRATAGLPGLLQLPEQL